MSVLIQGSQLRALQLGVRVDRATATLPQSTDQAIFTVAGGRVLITSLIGQVTTVIGTGTTPDLKIKYNPTATGTDFDLCTAVSISADAVGQAYYIAGNVATPGALLVGGAVGQANPVFAAPLALPAGDIEIDMDESVTGSVRWTLTYIPLDDGASVVAA